MAGFPATRLRRLRTSPALRRLVAETRLTVDDLVAPLFVADGLDEPRPVPSLPGVVQHTVDSAGRRGQAAERAWACPGSSCSGCRGPRTRTPPAPPPSGPTGSPSGPWPRCATRWATRWWSWPTAASTSSPTTATAASSTRPPVTWTTTPPLPLYAELAVSQAAAGADVIAPSGMMDGQVGAIRDALDAAGLRADGHPGLRGQVRLGPLRPVPRRGRGGHRRRWRPPGLPAGPGQPAGGAGRGGPRRGRGGRHGHGQAGPDLPRRHRRGAGRVRRPGGRLSRER